MNASDVQPLVEVTRGSIVESLHFGAVTVVDAAGNLVASIGNPGTFTYLRSSAKPIQVLPFVESSAADHFGISDRELAIMCASHHGTDEHVTVIQAIQARLGISAGDLLCGMHTPADKATAERMLLNHEENTPLRHNCSGKHTGMMAAALFNNLPIADYINPNHPIQQTIIKVFSEMTGVPVAEMAFGIDGCSAPVFAVPMRSAAWAFAQLADPSALPEPRCSALRRIFRAMTTNSSMVAGPGAFDTLLMEIGGGKILTKGGAEGYQAIAVLPGACGAGSPAYGITIKISDGDLFNSRARTIVAVEVLRQLGALDVHQLELLKEFTTRPQRNWKHLKVGEIRTCFSIK
jgi:L-asparaginase II